MSKAIKITGIIWAVLAIILAVVFYVIGAPMFGNIDQIAAEVVKQNPGTTLEVAKEATILTAYLFVCVASWFVVAAAYSFVLVGLSGKSMRKGVGIFLGVLGIVLGAELPGIFFIIHAAKDL